MVFVWLVQMLKKILDAKKDILYDTHRVEIDAYIQEEAQMEPGNSDS